LVRGIRNVRAQYRVDPGRRIPARISAGTKTSLLQSQSRIIVELGRVSPDEMAIAETITDAPKSATAVAADVVVYLPLAGMVDLEAELRRLEKEIITTQAELQHSERLLNNANFIERAPAEVVARERGKAERLRETLQQLQRRTSELRD